MLWLLCWLLIIRGERLDDGASGLVEHVLNVIGAGGQVLASDQFNERINLIEQVQRLEWVQQYDPLRGGYVEKQVMVNRPAKRLVVVNLECKIIVRTSEGKLVRAVVARDYDQTIAITSWLDKCTFEDGFNVGEAGIEIVDEYSRDRQKEVDLTSIGPSGPYELFRVHSRDSAVPIYNCQEHVSQEDVVKVVSANLWNHNHWELRKELIKEIISARNPALIGFQEVRSRKISHQSKARYQVADLQDILPGYEFVFQPAMMFKEEASGRPELVHEGLAIFSRLPIISSDFLKLSYAIHPHNYFINFLFRRRDPNDEADFHQRICLRVLVQTKSGPLNFMTTHLTLSESSRDRTLEEIGAFAEQSEFPTILVGDFNAGAPEAMKILSKYGFIDSALEIHPEWEKDPSGYTFNTWFEKSRIDLVLCRPSTSSFSDGLKLSTSAANLLGTSGKRIPGLSSAGGVSDTKDLLFPSDHKFVEIDYRID
jgi:endonuclease/exonuclease/phosphatase family metal-dependent hydrolase